jgi:hypothetical protein
MKMPQRAADVLKNHVVLKVCLNGHEWLKRQLAKRDLGEPGFGAVTAVAALDGWMESGSLTRHSWSRNLIVHANTNDGSVGRCAGSVCRC